MIIFRKIAKCLLFMVWIIAGYFFISIVTSLIPVNGKTEKSIQNNKIYLHSNGIHLDIIIPKQAALPSFINGISQNENTRYYSFGWGDENFYINTPNWSDLTFKNAANAMFLKSPTLMHVTEYENLKSQWIPISCSTNQLNKLQAYISKSFDLDHMGNPQILKDQGYFNIDNFYKANGNYSCINTCNTWVNKGFKDAGLKASLWTPFDRGLLHKHEGSFSIMGLHFTIWLLMTLFILLVIAFYFKWINLNKWKGLVIKKNKTYN